MGTPFKFIIPALVAAAMSTGCKPGKQTESVISLIPEPQEIIQSKGCFTLEKETTIGVTDATLLPAANYLAQLFRQSTGLELTITEGKGEILLKKQADPLRTKGSYSLTSTPKQLTVSSADYEGIMAGIQTLRQLLPASVESKTPIEGMTWEIPALTINDAPRMEWRGLMLDVSRHFYTPEEVKELLDLMALYKLNKFHWHLTDDQGWRIEIKQYPLLTEKGSWRKLNSHDRSCIELAKQHQNPDYQIPEERLRIVAGDTLYGGYYTQEQIRDIVSYAGVRGIDVLPEIDMPGHFLSAISAYKGVSCSDQPGWGAMFSSPVCPGKETALEFCKNIYSEVFQLFPYEYVHLGADEVEKTNWKKCPDCQSRIRREKLNNEEELQAWFVKDMERFFNRNGKKLMGWDEILEGGLSETATIMWWRSWNPQAIPTATAQGNRAVATPNANLYLDYQQDKHTLRNIYEYDPLGVVGSPEQKNLILGAQANIWCEWIPSRERMQFMVVPRMLALSEICWTEPEKKNWNDFMNRLIHHHERLDVLGVNYRIPDLEGFHDTNVFSGETELIVTCPDPRVEIRYTTDGTIPTQHSALYNGPLMISESTDFTFCTFGSNQKRGDYVKTRYIKTEMMKPVETKAVQHGLKAKWYDYNGAACSQIEKSTFNGEYIIPSVQIPEGVKGNIGLEISGYFQAPTDGVYTFHLLSDDGSMLYIGNTIIVDNDGAHAPVEKVGQAILARGAHPIRVQYFDHNGGTLHLKIIDPNGTELAGEELFIYE